jgi:hypothetical protein
VNKDSTPITIFLLFFVEVIQLLVAETNKYCSQCLDTPDNDGRCSWLPDVIVKDMFIFLAIIIQMGQVGRDTVKSY